MTLFSFGGIPKTRDVPDPIFLLSNRKSAFFLNMVPSLSVVHQDKLYSILADYVSSPITQVIHHYASVEVRREKGRESWILPFGKDMLFLYADKPMQGRWLFDIRKSGDTNTWGRHYQLRHDRNTLLLSFIKKTDKNEDDSHGIKEYGFAIGLAALDGALKAKGEWVVHKGMHCYDTAETRARSVLFVVAPSLQKVKSLLEEGIKDEHAIMKKHALFQEKVANEAGKQPDITIAHDGLERISLPLGKTPYLRFPLPGYDFDRLSLIPALLAQKECRRAVELLGSPPRDQEMLMWYVFRASQAFQALARHRCLPRYIKNDHLTLIGESALALTKTLSPIPFHINNKEDIVIQSLSLSLIDFVYRLTDDDAFREQGLAALQQVKQAFFRGNALHDLPNQDGASYRSFLAAYIFPSLLSSGEWSNHFTKLLDHVWKPEGSIKASTDDPFWLDHVSAIVLASLNNPFFKPFVDRIYRQSQRALYSTPFIGFFEKDGLLLARAQASFIEMAKARENAFIGKRLQTKW
ncbi:MAG: hypothetical protein ABIH34_03170 [Nanoarchaeota archaeon]